MARVKRLVLLVEKVQMVPGIWEARAHIGVGFHGKNRQGRTVLSAECVSPSEVRVWADDLIKQLHDVKRLATRIRWTNHPKMPARRPRRRKPNTTPD
jgi:hypothetical protein